MNLKLRLLCASFLLSMSAFSQLDFYGYMNSNYAGITGVALQPASIVDSRYKFDASLFGVGFSLGNNYIGLKKEVIKNHPDYSLIGAYKQLIKNDSTQPDPFPYFNDDSLQWKYMIERLNSDRKSVFLNVNVQLLSFMFKIGPKSSFGFNWRVRTYFNVDGVEPNLAHQIWLGLQDSAQWDKRLTNEKLSIQLNKNKKIERVHLNGHGCSISVASGSILADILKGKTIEEAKDLTCFFRDMMHGKINGKPRDIGDLEALEGVKKFPVRIKCALLPWTTFEEALKGHKHIEIS